MASYNEDIRDRNHRLTLQENTIRFNHYRVYDSEYDVNQYPRWDEQPMPRLSRWAGHQAYIRFQWHLPAWRMSPLAGGTLPDLETGTLGEFLSMPQAMLGSLRLRESKDFFAGPPNYVFQKTLGYGGNGLCIHYKREGDDDMGRIRDIALKVALSGWESQDLRKELQNQKKYARSSHIVQVLAQEGFGKPARRPYEDIDTDDSSDDEESSGDEDIETPRPPRKPRRMFSAAELNSKAEKWYPNRPDKDERSRIETTRGREAGEDAKDFIITELFQNGTLRDMILKINERNLRWPNRVLWSFWLCLVKQCIALAFPVRKFHPERRVRPDGDLDEVIPPAKYHWRMKRMVHFDIEISNEFVADLDTVDQHIAAPKLKLGDFGLSDEVKTQKRDCYYVQRRYRAKPGYYAPEQFVEEWDFIPNERNGTNICDEPIVGNYGPHTNVWAIALTLFNVITGCWPRTPPAAAYLTMEGGQQVITYGMDLLDARWNYVDIELRRMAARCMCHDPTQRPGLEELLNHAEAGLSKPPGDGEDDESIRRWIQDALNSASTEPDDLPMEDAPADNASTIR
ncbi:kinase-like domain-containing protein [Xylariaceae sp. FL0662B]|nr:kinase-like domain-containing protein [Xylariaceae sp. FL0662B]